ncbi:MAG TPA: hypothetical protein VGC09_19760 [Rhodopila sp.]
MAAKNAPLSRPTPWRDIVVLCRKCGKKCDGGFGPKQKDSLKTVLRQELRDIGRRRQVRVIETGCFGICPKNGVTALNATHPETLHVIPAGTDAEQAIRVLLGGHAVPATDAVEAA